MKKCADKGVVDLGLCALDEPNPGKRAVHWALRHS
jgi:hypothetical protein